MSSGQLGEMLKPRKSLCLGRVTGAHVKCCLLIIILQSGVGVNLVFKYVCSQGDKADKQALLSLAVSAV